MSVNRGNFAVGPSANSLTEFKAKSIKQTNESLAAETSGRSDNGTMHISWIKPKLRKWEIELPPCSSAEIYSLFSKIQGQEYYIKIWDISSPDPTTQHPEYNPITLKVYTSNTESDCYSGVIHNGLYQGVTFSAIEIGQENI